MDVELDHDLNDLTSKDEPKVDEETVKEPEQVKEGRGSTFTTIQGRVRHENPMSKEEGRELLIDD
jgi:hypothetical protein